MIYMDKDKTIWSQCDRCKIIMLAGVPWNHMTGGEIKSNLQAEGWEIGETCLCMRCNTGHW